MPKRIFAALAIALLAGACGDDTTAGTASSSTTTTEASASSSTTGPLVTAPESERIDLEEPTFSDPTNITNPLFTVTEVTQLLQLGVEEGVPLRVEVTVLPETRTVEWNGAEVEVIVSQFIAYSDGEIAEVALDFFAQADDGSVWYFGEEVDNYDEGVIADHEGAWLAGQDGPAGMIMPADPQVGDVYRPENIPDLVFEEVTVKATGETVDGPRGPVEGAISIEEHLMDGTTEDKVFAPGYGEFRAEAADELITVALGVPIDALSEALPSELDDLAAAANTAYESAIGEDFDAVAGAADDATAAWDSYQSAAEVPPLLVTQMDDALEALAGVADDGDEAALAAVHVGLATLDLQLQYRPQSDIDLARLDNWAQRLLIDAGADEPPRVAGDVAVLETIWNRVRHEVDAAAAEAVTAELATLREAADAEDTDAAFSGAEGLREALAAL